MIYKISQEVIYKNESEGTALRKSRVVKYPKKQTGMLNQMREISDVIGER